MKELDALMKKLDETGKLKALKLTLAVVPLPKNLKTEEEKQKMINKAIKHCFEECIFEDEKILELFAELANELAFEALIKELDIKPATKEEKIQKLSEFFAIVRKELED